MRISLFEGQFFDIDLENGVNDNGVDFDGSIWCCEDGQVFYRGAFSTIDDHGNCIPLPNFEPDEEELIEAMNIDKYDVIREYELDMGDYKYDMN